MMIEDLTKEYTMVIEGDLTCENTTRYLDDKLQNCTL